MSRRCVRLAAMTAIALIAISPASARPAATQATPITVIAMPPLSTLGSVDASAASRKLERQLANEFAAIAGAKVIASADLLKAMKAAKNPLLRTCDGDVACLAELGGTVGASHLVTGEVGGLGDVRVVYLALIDVQAGTQLRTAQVALGADAETHIRGGAMQLLAPDRYVGQLAVTTQIAGAAMYVDGKRTGQSPAAPIVLAVGTHALRVTHPEHRDFVRFVDISFEKETKIDVELQKYASVERAIDENGGATRPVRYVETPARWYRRWWAIAGFGTAVLVGAIVIGAATTDGVAADLRGTVEPP